MMINRPRVCFVCNFQQDGISYIESTFASRNNYEVINGITDAKSMSR